MSQHVLPLFSSAVSETEFAEFAYNIHKNLNQNTCAKTCDQNTTIIPDIPLLMLRFKNYEENKWVNVGKFVFSHLDLNNDNDNDNDNDKIIFKCQELLSNFIEFYDSKIDDYIYRDIDNNCYISLSLYSYMDTDNIKKYHGDNGKIHVNINDEYLFDTISNYNCMYFDNNILYQAIQQNINA